MVTTEGSKPPVMPFWIVTPKVTAENVAAQVLETMQSEGGAPVQRFGLRQVGHAVEWFSVRQDGPALNVAPDPEVSYWSAHSDGP